MRAYVCVHTHVCSHVCVCVCIQMHAYVEIRVQLWLSSSKTAIYLFWDSISDQPEAHHCLAGQWAPKSCLSPQCWGCKHTPSHHALLWELRVLNSSLCSCKAYRLSHPSCSSMACLPHHFKLYIETFPQPHIAMNIIRLFDLSNWWFVLMFCVFETLRVISGFLCWMNLDPFPHGLYVLAEEAKWNKYWPWKKLGWNKLVLDGMVSWDYYYCILVLERRAWKSHPDVLASKSRQVLGYVRDYVLRNKMEG